MALVIDVSGSMSGELKIMIPFLCLLVGYLGKPVGLGLDCKTVWLFELTMTPVIRQKCPKASGGSGGGGGGGTGSLILDQTKARRVKKNFWRPPPRLHLQLGWKRLQRIEAKLEDKKITIPQ